MPSADTLTAPAETEPSEETLTSPVETVPSEPTVTAPEETVSVELELGSGASRTGGGAGVEEEGGGELHFGRWFELGLVGLVVDEGWDVVGREAWRS